MTASDNSKDVKSVAVKAAGSSGSSEGCSKLGGMDDKKRRRMESNRESARRSRQKKQQHLDGLIKQVGGLTRENDEIETKIQEVSGIFGNFEAQNRVLRSEKDRLAARLESLETIIDIAKVVRGGGGSTSSQTTTTTTTTTRNRNNNEGSNNNNNGGVGECMYELGSKNGGDPMRMKPWQLPCPSMPLIASSGLHCSYKF